MSRSGARPVAEIGATVTVRNEVTGTRHTWKLVNERSTVRADGELTASTPAAQALLGHGVGDAVEYTAAQTVRLLITDLVQAPPRVTTPPPPLPDTPVLEFGRGQDAAYEDWAHSNPGGYVLIYGSSRGYMIHQADCSHIGLDGEWTLKTTSASRPRLCSKSRRVLEHRSREELGQSPVPCGTCSR